MLLLLAYSVLECEKRSRRALLHRLFKQYFSGSRIGITDYNLRFLDSWSRINLCQTPLQSELNPQWNKSRLTLFLFFKSSVLYLIFIFFKTTFYSKLIQVKHYKEIKSIHKPLKNLLISWLFLLSLSSSLFNFFLQNYL